MGSVNKVILVGNLGRDAELRYTPGGAPVATLNQATTEVWNDKVGKDGRVAERIPHEGQADLRRGTAADPAVGRQGRQQTLHHRNTRRPHRPARWRRRRRGRATGCRPRRGERRRRGRGRAHGRAGFRAERRRYSLKWAAPPISRGYTDYKISHRGNTW